MPDNLRGGVTKACYYEPELNPTYAELATHYGTVVLPTRTARPRDKAAAEAGVLSVERWVLAPLRERTFFSLADLNAAVTSGSARSTPGPSAGSRRRERTSSKARSARRCGRFPRPATSWRSGRRSR